MAGDVSSTGRSFPYVEETANSILPYTITLVAPTEMGTQPVSNVTPGRYESFPL